jgi:5-methylcytosine-specific restriction endonuclease McrA
MTKKRKSRLSKEAQLRSFVIKTLRRASLFWGPRNECLRKARVERGLYMCASCKACVSKKELRVDHKITVIPLSGFDSFDGIIRRLFCEEEGLQALCVRCHDIKTEQEDKVRGVYREGYISTEDVE